MITGPWCYNDECVSDVITVLCGMTQRVHQSTYRAGPGVPGGRDGTAGSNSGVVEETVGGILVADDIGGGIGIGGDVAVV